MSGQGQKGIQYATDALRLSPRDPSRYFIRSLLGWVYFSAGDYSSGADSAQRSIGEAPNFPSPYLSLVLNLIGLGEIARGKSEFGVMRNLAPEMVEARLAGQWSASSSEWLQRATTFLRIAAGQEEPGAADAVR